MLDEAAELVVLVAAADLAKRVRPIDRDRPVVIAASAAMRAAIFTWLHQLERAVQVRARRVLKAAAGDDAEAVAAVVDDSDTDTLADDLRRQMRNVALDGAARGLEQVGAMLRLDQANVLAIDWAEQHSGELVTQVAKTTRQAVRDLTAQALNEGWSNDTLADAMDATFSESRADMIARTETATADIQGNLIGWRSSGVVSGKEWLLSDDACDECTAYDGVVVGLDEDFGEGDPPLHPRCRCDVLPVLDDAE